MPGFFVDFAVSFLLAGSRFTELLEMEWSWEQPIQMH